MQHVGDLLIARLRAHRFQAISEARRHHAQRAWRPVRAVPRAAPARSPFGIREMLARGGDRLSERWSRSSAWRSSRSARSCRAGRRQRLVGMGDGLHHLTLVKLLHGLQFAAHRVSSA